MALCLSFCLGVLLDLEPDDQMPRQYQPCERSEECLRTTYDGLLIPLGLALRARGFRDPAWVRPARADDKLDGLRWIARVEHHEQVHAVYLAAPVLDIDALGPLPDESGFTSVAPSLPSEPQGRSSCGVWARHAPALRCLQAQFERTVDSNAPANRALFCSGTAPGYAPMTAAASAVRVSEERVAAIRARLANPEAVLSRSDVRDLGYERRAVDAIFRACPVVSLPGYSRVLIRVADYLSLIERSTYRDDRVRGA